MVKVVFLCKGSRGDVLPLLSIALAYKNTHFGDTVTIVCTATSISGLDEKLAGDGIEIISILREVNVASSDRGRLQLLKHEAGICYEASVGARLIVFNLFSLEGYFIAQELNVPCIAASPFLLSRTPPTSFRGELAKASPALFKALTTTPEHSEVVTYAEVDHWMWRLFLDDWGSVCDHLGFSSRTPLTLRPLPPPTPLLYGLSSLLTPRQPYWPNSVRVCGYWVPPPCFHCPPSDELTTIVQHATAPLVYIGFGSMESYMEDIDWEALFVVLDTAFKDVNMQGIFQCKEIGPISTAFCQLSWKPERLTVWSMYAPHQWLFEKCAAILHHGGSGTVATALLSRKPQLICPVLFDQHHWAEVIAWKSLGVHLTSVKQLTVEELRRNLLLVCSGQMADNIDAVCAEIVKEDGVRIALIEMDNVLCK